MIAKIIEGRSFGGCIGYVLKPDSEIIHSNGLRTDSQQTITQDFNLQRMLNPRLGKAVGHIILSWKAEDKQKLNNAVMVSAANRYLLGLEIRDTQCLMVRHYDRNHDHVHIIFNRVNDHGKTISDSNLRNKSFKLCKELNKMYGFQQALGKNDVNRGRLKGVDKVKYQIYDTVKAGIKNSSNWQELQNFLKYRGVDVQFKFKQKSNEIQGVSFSKNGQVFSGSSIDRSMSFSRIDQSFNTTKNEMFIHQKMETKQEHDTKLSSSLLEASVDLMTSLLAPVYIAPDQDDRIFRKKKKKKKKKHLGY